MIRDILTSWIYRIAGRLISLLNPPLIEKAPTAKIYPEARIVNMQSMPDAISIGHHTHIRGELLTFAHGGMIQLGEYCYLGEGSKIWSARNIVIGNRVLISHNVNIFDNQTHPLDAEHRHGQFKAIITRGHPTSGLDLGERAVHIGDDVLISCQSIILRGVTIGQGAIIGAGSVVTKDVLPWTVVAGNPARVIRKLNPSPGGAKCRK